MTAQFIRKITFTAIAAAALTAPAYAITLDQFHGWLSSSWGETDENGVNDGSEGCKDTHKLAPEYAGKFKGSGIYGKYLDGSLAFSNIDGGFTVASGYFTPEEINQLDYMERSSKTRVTKLSTAVVTGPKGDSQLSLEAEIPGLARPRTIIPITAHSFKLIPPEGTEGGFGGARIYYFKRCGMP